MAELRRLGKRGSYRLGRLGAPPPAPAQPPAPHYPSWTNRHRGALWLWLLAWLAAVAVVAVTALLGLWFMPFLAGLAAGIAARAGHWRLRVSLPAVILLAAAGWGAALWWLVLRQRRPGARARPSQRPATAWITATSSVTTIATSACGGSPASAAISLATAPAGS